MSGKLLYPFLKLNFHDWLGNSQKRRIFEPFFSENNPQNMCTLHYTSFWDSEAIRRRLQENVIMEFKACLTCQRNIWGKISQMQNIPRKCSQWKSLEAINVKLIREVISSLEFTVPLRYWLRLRITISIDPLPPSDAVRKQNNLF